MRKRTVGRNIQRRRVLTRWGRTGDRTGGLARTARRPSDPSTVTKPLSRSKHPMKALLSVLTMAIALALATPAFAKECPTHVKAIDAKLATMKDLPADKVAKIKQLRNEGERLHKAGKHADSLKTLLAAEALLASK
jgi:hypothetical protein